MCYRAYGLEIIDISYFGKCSMQTVVKQQSMTAMRTISMLCWYKNESNVKPNGFNSGIYCLTSVQIHAIKTNILHSRCNSVVRKTHNLSPKVYSLLTSKLFTVRWPFYYCYKLHKGTVT